MEHLPKVELHLHLDCSPSFAAISTLDPAMDRERFAREIQLVDKCRDLSEFLARVPRIGQLLHSEEALRVITRDLFRQLRADGVIYAEIRFAPLLHLEAGLTPERVVAAVNQAVGGAIAETGVEGRLILCTLRHFSEQQGLLTVELAKQFSDEYVVALDLAADEAGFPLDAHEAAFRLADKLALHRTAHAGEALGAASVWQTLARLRPERIGHGVRSIEDPKLVEYLAERRVHLEVCPSCNVLIDVVDDFASHPIDRLYRAGVPVSINTDGRTVPTVTLSDEYRKLAEVFGWGTAEFLECNRAALRAAFLPEDRKGQIEAALETGYSGAVQ